MKCKFLAWGLLAILVWAPIAYGKIYKWVDDTGKVRFSDTPPPGQQQAVDEVTLEQPSSGHATASGADKLRKVLPKADAIMARSAERNREIMVENILAGLDVMQGNDSLVAGQHYEIKSSHRNRFYGAGDLSQYTAAFCETRGRDLQSAHIEPLVAQSRQMLREHLMSYIAGLGYRTAGVGNPLFRHQEQVTAELSIAGIIRDVFVEECGMGASLASPSFNRTYVKIEWQLFDNLEKRVVHTLTTEGRHDAWEQAPRNKGTLLSLAEASKDALTRLFAQDEFVAALYAGNREVATAAGGVSRLSVAMSASASGESFLSEIDTMKSAIVTVRTAAGHGSGFVISADGHVVTNYHVVGESTRVILIIDGTEVYANVLLTDKVRDVALLKTELPLAVAPLGRINRKVALGEAIYIVGTPLAEALSHTVTKGIVSGFRKREGLDYYQTDAAVNPGNSGGPVFNEKGELVAIAVQGFFTSEGASLNTNFLIPIEEAFSRLGVEVHPQ